MQEQRERIKTEGNERYVEYPINDPRDFDDFCLDPLSHAEMILDAFPYADFPDLKIRVLLNYENPPGVRLFTRSGKRILKKPGVQTA